MSGAQRYEFSKDLNREVAAVCESIQPVEVVAKAGDVLFFDIMTAHSGSCNIGTEPRLALNHKYGVTKALNIT